MSKPPFYITTPLYYVNDELHVGHATTTFYADTLARFRRLDGYEVTFLTGSDEHGQKIWKAAKAWNMTPKAFADSIVDKFRQLWVDLGIEYDQFIRTTEPFHEKVVQSLFQRLKDRGLVYKGTYRALYCTDCEQAYSPSTLVDGKCPIHKTVPVNLDEDNYFFALSKFALFLRARLGDESLTADERTTAATLAKALGLPLPPADLLAIQPVGRRSEILGKLREGLEDVSISRTAFDWGVSMPGDSAHVIWVWFDALINYVSMQLKDEVESRKSGELPEFGSLLASKQFNRLWKAQDDGHGKRHNAVHHLIGKDILWHHSVVWWSMLHGAGIDMPHRVFAHGWWTVESDKMSKTLGNVIRPADFVRDIANRITSAPLRPGQEAFPAAQAIGVARDALRFYVLRHGPAKGDADFRRDHFFATYNNELAGELGNLLSRVLGMLAKYFNATVPAAGAPVEGTEKLREVAASLHDRLHQAYDAFDFSDALEATWLLVRAANKYIDDTQPFKLAKDPARAGELATVMHALCQTLAVLGRVLMPVLPESAPHLLWQLGLVPTPEAAKSSSLLNQGLKPCVEWLDTLPGTVTQKGVGMFPRLDGAAN